MACVYVCLDDLVSLHWSFFNGENFKAISMLRNAAAWKQVMAGFGESWLYLSSSLRETASLSISSLHFSSISQLKHLSKSKQQTH